ncbi:MAG: type I 3-dehydroquinate dehydratase [Usitatibacteraceae bacterium]
MKSLTVRGRRLNPDGHVLICTALAGRTASALQAELRAILPKRPDFIEWRVDFFDGIADLSEVLTVAKSIRAGAGDIPIIFTRRAQHEGGEAIGISEESVVAMYEAVCASGAVDFIDYELSQPKESRARLRSISRAHDVQMIMSYHNFGTTPSLTEIVAKLTAAETEGADVGKVAVMPNTPHDVLLLLEATLAADESLRIPLITMSMGERGAVTRVCGWQYGSVLTFAAGERSSAPGQLPIEELRQAMKTLKPAAPRT